jgi:dihydrolipoamide dehydrogenase
MTYDLIVIGSGPGGYSAAVRAGQYGLKTAIIEKDPKLGGTCLHVGCIPTKALLHTADVWEHFVNHPPTKASLVRKPALNYPKVLDRKNGIVSKHAKGVEFLMKKNKVEWIKGYGVPFWRSGRQGGSEVGNGVQTLETKNVMIATGSEARMLPGLSRTPTILTNIEILNLRRCRSRC